MSSDASNVRYVLLAAVAAVVLTLAVNFGYGMIFLPRRGASAAVWSEIRGGAPHLVLGLFLAAVGAILGARLAAGQPRGVTRWTAGLAAGVGLAVVVVAAGWFQGDLDFWLPPNAAMAVVGAWLGGSLAGKALAAKI